MISNTSAGAAILAHLGLPVTPPNVRAILNSDPSALEELLLAVEGPEDPRGYSNWIADCYFIIHPTITPHWRDA